MIETGMNIARLNFSHGSYEYHGSTISNIRAAAANYSKKVGMEHPLAIALDTKGPEIRTGLLEGGGSAEIELNKGEKIKLTTDTALTDKGNKDCIFVDYTNIVKVVQVGSKIFVDDGLISLIVVEIGEFIKDYKKAVLTYLLILQVPTSWSPRLRTVAFLAAARE